MRNKNKPFFYEEKKTSFGTILPVILILAVLALLWAYQVPTIRQVLSDPIYSTVSLMKNSAKDFLDATRMGEEETVKPQTYPVPELPDRQVLFAEDLSGLSEQNDDDPLADLRMAQTPSSEYENVAEWEYLDTTLNYKFNQSDDTEEEAEHIALIPPVFERADLFNGAAAILSADLRYWGETENQYQIANVIHPTRTDPSVTFSDMNRYLTVTYPDKYAAIERINGSAETLTALLRKGIPVIIQILDQTPYPSWRNDDRLCERYLLVYGYDSESDSFLCQDTNTPGSHSFLSADLLAAWYPFQRTYIVVYPQDMETDVLDALSEDFYEELNLQRAETKSRTDSEMLPDNPYAQYFLAEILQREEDYAGALELYQRAVENGLPDRYFYYRTGVFNTLLHLGYADDMDSLLEQPLRRNSGDDILLVYRGWADILREDYNKASSVLNQAAKINPGNETVQYALKYLETMVEN